MRKCYTKRCERVVINEYIPMKMRFFAKDSLDVLHDVTKYIKSFTKVDYRFNITLYDETVVSLSFSTMVFADNNIDVHLIVEHFNKWCFEL